VSITHLILERATSHVSERLIVAIASLAIWRAFSADDISARGSAAGGVGTLGRRSVGGEDVSEPTAVDRVVFVKSWAIEDVAPLPVDAWTSVDWGLVVSMGKTGGEVAFGDTIKDKKSVIGSVNCPAFCRRW
jgi:hypothetical protein